MPSLEIRTSYKDFTTDCDATAAVKSYIQNVPNKYLSALREIVLTNGAEQSRQKRRRRVWSRGRKRRVEDALAVYHAPAVSDMASIEIFIDRIFNGVPWMVQRIPLLRDLLLAPVFYHELGHHIDRCIDPRHDEEVEDIADQWKRRLMRRMFWRKYWYVMPLFRVSGSVRTLWRRFVRGGA
jgi:hypothetical protein